MCRLQIRKSMGPFNLDKVDQLGLVPPFDDFVAYRELFISAGQHIYDTHMVTISKVSKVLKEVAKDPAVRHKYAHCPGQAIIKQIAEFTLPDHVNQEQIIDQVHQEPNEAPAAINGAPAPPPPPPPPIPPRPGFWRFPGAEFSGKAFLRR